MSQESPHATFVPDMSPFIELLCAEQVPACAFAVLRLSETREEPHFYKGGVLHNKEEIVNEVKVADLLFCMGSIMKIIINIAMYRLLEEGHNLLVDDPDVWELMRGAWKEPAFKLYNNLRGYRGTAHMAEPRKYHPTIEQLMTHCCGILSYQLGLVGPDGSVVMSEETFAETLPRMMDMMAQPENDEHHYSNWNSMLLGFIIERATGMSLAKALEWLVLEPCGMENTILRKELYEQRNGIAEPHVNTADGVSGPTTIVNCFDNSAALSILGGFTCVEDMTRLMAYVLKRVRKDDQKIIEKLFNSGTQTSVASSGKSHNGVLDGVATPLGIYGPLDSELMRYESFERLDSTPVPCLGLDHGKSVSAISKAGTVRGYACYLVTVPSSDLVIAVMTNASGIADLSYIVAQHLLQTSLTLHPRIQNLRAAASKIYSHNLKFLHQHTICHQKDQGFDAQEIENLAGCYRERSSRQRVIIEKQDYVEGHDTRPGLKVHIMEGGSNGSQRTTDMTLIKVRESVLAFLPAKHMLAVDTYDAWRKFGLRAELLNGKVRSLQRVTVSQRVEKTDDRHTTYNEVYEREETGIHGG